MSLHDGGAADPADFSELRRQLQALGEQQQKLYGQLQAGERQFRQLARSVWRVQEDERRRLARDLHDGIGQHLTALRHRLDGLIRAGDTRSQPALEQALQLCDLAIRETRAMSRLLRPQILDDLGLEAALGWLARQNSEASGCAIDVTIHDLPPTLDGERATLLFRLVQEALSNALKHASARSILVRISQRDAALQLLVVDDGCGCDIDAAWARSSAGQSTGLASMRERVRLFGGRLNLVSTPGEGLQLRALLPLYGDDAP